VVFEFVAFSISFFYIYFLFSALVLYFLVFILTNVYIVEKSLKNDEYSYSKKSSNEIIINKH
jgi:hypothetical protein